MTLPSSKKSYNIASVADMSQTVYRRLLEQRWREEGTLDLLVSRIRIMYGRSSQSVLDGAYSSNERRPRSSSFLASFL